MDVLGALRLRLCLPAIGANTIGPKEKGTGNRKTNKSYVLLNWLRGVNEWRSLVIPATEKSGRRTGDVVDLALQAQWTEKGDWENVGGAVQIEVPSAGIVAVQTFRQKGNSQWHSGDGDRIPIAEFVGHAQIQAAGGVEQLRGVQIPVQFATDNVMLSFLLYIPNAAEPRPLFMFFHGDMDRGLEECSQPGLADFCDIYGPAFLVSDKNPKQDARSPCRDFVVITPCCSEDVWWLRHPALHDSTSYAVSVERCLKAIIKWTHELRISSPEQGTRFVGQSMGAYTALEIARAMPDEATAVLAGAPCFDACRLDHLAHRLVNVPVWLLIGRNDSLCCFEEIAALALKMRDLDAKFVRLTSAGIKGHSEVGAKLEKKAVYQWLLDPMQ